MKYPEVREVVKSLIGNIKPVGVTETDNERYSNLIELCQLVDDLVKDIDDVSFEFKDRQEYSVKRASEYAKKFLTDKLGITE